MQRTGPLDIFKEAKHWKTDVPSGLVVFLVAIPLCLGIALASGGSAMSGIIAGIVGGLVVTLFSNSSLGVSGPAAGLVAIVAPAILTLGFQNFLLAVVLAGVIQFVLGVLKAGTIGYYFPTSVIKGMLAAIGLIIILKQIPHAVGYDKDFEGDMAFSQADGHNTFSEIYYAICSPSIGPVIVTLVCLAILIVWQTKSISKFSWSKIIQGPLVAVLLGSRRIPVDLPALQTFGNHVGRNATWTRFAWWRKRRCVPCHRRCNNQLGGIWQKVGEDHRRFNFRKPDARNRRFTRITRFIQCCGRCNRFEIENT